MIRLKDILLEQHGVDDEGFAIDIEKEAKNNDYFRKVIHTTSTLQLVVMSIEDDAGEEIHPRTTQFFRIESGTGKAVINGEEFELKDGISVIVPPGARHNVINTGKSPLKVYTIYAPPKHPPGQIDIEKPIT